MTTQLDLLSDVESLMLQGKGEDAISRALSITRHRARDLTVQAERRSIRVAMMRLRPSADAPAEAWAARITACWRASVEAILEVGRLLMAAKASLPHGEFLAMVENDLPFGERTTQMLMAVAADERLSNPKFVSYLPPSWGTLYELTKLPNDDFEEKIRDGTIHPDMRRKDLFPEKPPEVLEASPERPALPAPVEPAAQMPASAALPAPATAPSTAVIVTDESPALPRAGDGNRVEPVDSLDFFPTPPWATRALLHVVLPPLGVRDLSSVWEPACGHGHITGVLEELPITVIGSDIKDYGADGRMAPGWWRALDFTDAGDGEGLTPCVDWIITNPPFGDPATKFMVRALDLARVGVAMFLQLRYQEGVERYNLVYRDRPPTVVAPFVERVPLHKGRWEPDGDTRAAFMWLVWVRDMAPRPTFWIPPGCREKYSRPDDERRFTAVPVIGVREVGDVRPQIIAKTSPDARVTDDPIGDHSDRLELKPQSPPAVPVMEAQP